MGNITRYHGAHATIGPSAATDLIVRKVAQAHDLYPMPEKFTLPAAGPLRVVFQSGDSFPANFIELAPVKFASYLKHENLGHAQAWREKNGEAAKPGRERSKYVKPPVQVLFRGKPTRDVAVESAWLVGGNYRGGSGAAVLPPSPA